MIEHTIENSMGVGFFMFFLLLFLNRERGIEEGPLADSSPQAE